MTVLFATHPACLEHLAGPHHPERPERLEAVLRGVTASGVGDGVRTIEPRWATRDEIVRVHPGGYLDAIERVCAAGGGRLDPDTLASAGTWNAVLCAAGAGLTAIEILDAGGGESAFCAVRPPGHHATAAESMGFCIVNNVAVAAAELAERGERVLIVDYDAHHGNGTQDIFYADGRVLYVSIHQWPLYPGTGRPHELGEGSGWGTTLNIPVPPGATGDVYLAAFDRLAAPIVDQFRPTWAIVSAGFDAHRFDPITELGLSSADYPALTRRILDTVAPGRRLVMLEGGYDLDALTASTAAVVRELAGLPSEPVEDTTSGGPGMAQVDGIVRMLSEAGLA